MKQKEYKYNPESLRFEEVVKTISDGQIALFILGCLALTIFITITIARISYKNKVINTYISDKRISDSIIISLKKDVSHLLGKYKEVKVTATCYNAVEGQTNSNPLITADGSFIEVDKIEDIRWIAISRDLEKQDFHMGDSVLVQGVGNGYDGIWTIRDRMNKRFKNKIDFLISENKKGGLFKNIKLIKL
jgi:3D (Asp-Asp-Asp) domain-containing protein